MAIKGFPILPAHVCTDLGLRVQREGTLDTDTICTCDEGLHCTSDTCESCTPHSLCPPGFGVKQIGKWPVGQSALEETGAGQWALSPRGGGNGDSSPHQCVCWSDRKWDLFCSTSCCGHPTLAPWGAQGEEPAWGLRLWGRLCAGKVGEAGRASRLAVPLRAVGGLLG